MNCLIKSSYMDTSEFFEFIGTPACKIYFYLLKFVITGRPRWDLEGINLYDKYFMNGDLVSRYSLEDLSVYMELSESVISKHIKKLNELGFVETLKLNIGKKRYNIYKLGWVENGKCMLLFDEVLNKSPKARQIIDIVKELANFNIDAKNYDFH